LTHLSIQFIPFDFEVFGGYLGFNEERFIVA
jgi:hypothetical protein